MKGSYERPSNGRRHLKKKLTHYKKVLLVQQYQSCHWQ